MGEDGQIPGPGSLTYLKAATAKLVSVGREKTRHWDIMADTK